MPRLSLLLFLGLLLQPSLSSTPSSCSSAASVKPIVSWAQNATHVAFEVKFTTRASAPARSGYKVSEFRCEAADPALPADDFSDGEEGAEDDDDDEEGSAASPLQNMPAPAPSSHSSVYVFSAPAECGPGDKTFVLDVSLWGPVKESEVAYKDSSAGRVTVLAEKKSPTSWESLVRTKADRTNVRKWEAMQAQMDKEEAAIKERVQKTMDELNKKKNSKKKKKKKKAKTEGAGDEL
ncbi:hypothetical protein TeGR_g2036 [Tetraparma gracilis]|uniref:CS domain-containing protein n=1 Tax=Tetraparma gracilis TaxID=2962635 RepID=A0ABQ6MWD4_9STRA|nr:hypothetical protein TeGR_g2036 [Tetraparma gracilis]